MLLFLFFTSRYPIISFDANKPWRYFEYGVAINMTIKKCFKEIFHATQKYFNWHHIEDKLDVI